MCDVRTFQVELERLILAVSGSSTHEYLITVKWRLPCRRTTPPETFVSVGAQCYSRALLSVQLTLRWAVGELWGLPCRRSWHDGRTVTALISLGYDSFLFIYLFFFGVEGSFISPATDQANPADTCRVSGGQRLSFDRFHLFGRCEESSLFRRCLGRELLRIVLDSLNWGEHRCEETKSVKCLSLWRCLCGGNSCKVLCAALPWNYAHWKPSPSCSQASAMRGRWSSRSMSVFVSLIVLWQTR